MQIFGVRFLIILFILLVITPGDTVSMPPQHQNGISTLQIQPLMSYGKARRIVNRQSAAYFINSINLIVKQNNWSSNFSLFRVQNWSWVDRIFSSWGISSVIDMWSILQNAGNGATTWLETIPQTNGNNLANPTHCLPNRVQFKRHVSFSWGFCSSPFLEPQQTLTIHHQKTLR